MDIKDSKSLGDKVGEAHKLLCLILKARGEKGLILSTLADYIKDNKLNK